MARREYQGGAVSTTITGGITSNATSLVLALTTGWPTGSFSAVIDPGNAGEEKILCTSRSGSTVTITTRGYDGTTASAHVAGVTIYPVPTAIDFDEANAHTTSTGVVHGLTGSIVGTTDTQTLTNKSLSDATTSFIDSVDATKVLKVDVTGTTGVTGTLTSAFTTAKTLTLPDATDTLVGKATTDTLTNKTLTDAKIDQAVNAQTGTTYTPVLTDDSKIVTLNNAAAIAVTIPTNASVAFPIGARIDFAWITGAGQPTISAVTPGTTTIISTGATAASPKLSAVNAACTAIKIATDTWLVVGSIS